MGMYLLPTFLIVAIVAANAAVVKVSIYYESLSPNSRNWFKTQLAPVYEKWGSQIKLDLVPYGRTIDIPADNGTHLFLCRFGEEECFGNQYHACAVDFYSQERSSKFILCSMTSENPASYATLTKCAGENGLDIKKLDGCFISGLGSDLYAKNGQKTKAVPYIFDTPELIFNDVYRLLLRNRAQTDLEGVIEELSNNA